MKEKKENNLTFKSIGGAVLALLLSLTLMLVANAALPFRHFGPGTESPGPFQDAFANLFLIHAVLSFAMLAMSFYLFFIYLKDYLQLKSRFTVGLLLAVFSFMLFAVAANPFLHVFFGVYGRSGIFQLIPYFFASVSLAILLWVSSK
ncbi:hypothetical protein JXA56_01325 [Candidatus Micrarchaeota archaeon]|nr:hypothetical protein [Candidatus Micrarchaeota archaeon]